MTDPSADFKCAICRDARFVHPAEGGRPVFSRVVPCGCAVSEMEFRKQQALLRLCELPNGTEKWTFENFQIYPEVKNAYDCALELAEESGPLRWLTLVADVDVGKTHLAVAICRRWLARCKPARYGWVPLLLDELKQGMDNKEYDQRFQFLLNVPLLILDDMGTQNSTPWVTERLETLVDYRYVNDLPLMITTNLPVDRLGIRVASRIMRKEGSRIVTIDAPEYRTRKPVNLVGITN